MKKEQFDLSNYNMYITKKKKNLHFWQKLCWQQGIITASLKNESQREHFSSDGK